MGRIINEALLEMHFHKALVEFFKNKYGAEFLRLIKPSSREEKWLGFDQGWVNSEFDHNRLVSEIRNAITNNHSHIKIFYLGFFLQFKVVFRIGKKSTHMPQNYFLPYYRSELSLKPDPISGLSQHETLLRLQNIPNASVSYACPMFFDLDEIYHEVNLGNLRLVPLNSAPAGWLTNTRHFITFQTTDDPNPKWCSEISEGVSYSFDEWASEKNIKSPKLQEPKDILELIDNTIKFTKSDEAIERQRFPIRHFLSEKPKFFENRNQIPPSFTLIEIAIPSDQPIPK